MNEHTRRMVIRVVLSVQGSFALVGGSSTNDDDDDDVGRLTAGGLMTMSADKTGFHIRVFIRSFVLRLLLVVFCLFLANDESRKLAMMRKENRWEVRDERRSGWNDER